MAQPPAYNPPEQQKSAWPPQGSYPQPGAYPQGQPAPYPQGQPAPYPQGQPVAYPTGQAQPGVAYGGQQVIVTQGNDARVHTGSSQGGCCGSSIAEHYNTKAGLGTGVVHLVVSILSIILGGVAYAFPVLQAGYGIWSAIIFYIPTGILGVVSYYKNSSVVVAYMVMSILTSLQAFGMLVYEAFVAAVWSFFTYCYFDFYSYSEICDSELISVGAVVVHSLLALLGLVEFINAIVSAAYCCRGHSCCCAPASPTNQGAVTTQTV